MGLENSKNAFPIYLGVLLQKMIFSLRKSIKLDGILLPSGPSSLLC